MPLIAIAVMCFTAWGLTKQRPSIIRIETAVVFILYGVYGLSSIGDLMQAHMSAKYEAETFSFLGFFLTCIGTGVALLYRLPIARKIAFGILLIAFLAGLYAVLQNAYRGQLPTIYFLRAAILFGAMVSLLVALRSKFVIRDFEHRTDNAS